MATKSIKTRPSRVTKKRGAKAEKAAESAAEIRTAFIGGLLTQLERQLVEARDFVIDGGDTVHGTDNDTLHGLCRIRNALLTVTEVRQAVGASKATVTP